MSIKKKIILIFTVSFAIVAIFGLVAGLDFWETRKDFRFLKISDSIRSRVLQLRRHEKNLFLYGDHTETRKMREVFDETDQLIRQGMRNDRFRQITFKLKTKVREYKKAFRQIIESQSQFRNELLLLKKEKTEYAFLIPIIEDTFLTNPVQILKELRKFFSLPEDSRAVLLLRQIESQQRILRKTGEDIIDLSRELDRGVRIRVQNVLKTSETGILVLFPLTFIFGFITIFLVVQSITKRLNELMHTILHAGEGFFSPMPFPSGRDEVGTLIRTYNNMAEALKVRDLELKKKEAELMHSKKLASIGTLASGVAHELNNPLNNIHISAQILRREMGPNCPSIVHETVEDILNQSIRVKKTVGDLLEFARYKDPRFVQTNLVEIIQRTFNQVKRLTPTDRIHFTLDAPPMVELAADPVRMERVFLNLFTNAVDAMEGKGELKVSISAGEDSVRVVVRDTGRGIPGERMEKIFDPFFTTKDKGTGLGLSITYNIIKNHHGTIRVESTEGRGTTFSILLPRVQ